MTQRILVDARYWNFVEIGAHDACWPWKGATLPTGYGVFTVYRDDGAKAMVKAHRWAHDRYIEPVPKELVVRHTCDNPSCQNPSHHVLGTHQDNMDDRATRGRTAKGIRVMTPEQVQEVFDMRRTGLSQQKIADHFDVAQTTISAILRRR